MKTKMETVAEEVALEVLLKVSTVVEPPIHLEQLKRSFYSKFTASAGQFPMSEAMNAALHAAVVSKGQAAAEWNTLIVETWERVVNEAVEEYFSRAERSFDGDEHLEGTEILTDAVRVVLGYIAARRGWPHATDDDLYKTVAALATGGGFPSDDENLYVLLDGASPAGMDLCGALGASMGRPDSVKCGFYGDSPKDVRRDALLFARTTIQLANWLAGEKAVAN